MSDRHITKLAIQGLEFLFSPPGLPIVDKGAISPTTSIAILGDAGAGKTTLAAALAHAISTNLNGVALYLTTELAPIEIKYKISLLALNAKTFSWKHRAQASIGDIIGQHLALLEENEEPIRRRALEAAWRLIEEGDTNNAVIRCVVIDAFPLPMEGSSAGSMRDEIVTLMQALESRGISVVIIQESTGVTDFVPFITDVVFQLRFDIDGDTGERTRKLSCTKSRYARSFVGPHDTGLDRDRLSVWPDPLSIVTSSSKGTLPVVGKPVRVFLPVGEQNNYIVETTGALFLSSIESQGWLVRVLRETPGTQMMYVHCGPITKILAPGKRFIDVIDSQGAYSLAWAILRAQESSGANTVLIQNLEILLRRKRFRATLEHVLEALRECGMHVCVHASNQDLNWLGPLADFEADGRFRGPKSMKARRHRSAAQWMIACHWPVRVRSSTREGRNDVEKAHRIAAELCRDTSGDNLDRFPSEFDNVQLVTKDEPGTRSASLRLAIFQHLLGFEKTANARVDLPTREKDRTISAQAWSYTAIGRDWEASKAVIDVMSHDHETPEEIAALWAGLTAVYAKSGPALDVAMAELATTPALLDLVIRALAFDDRWSEIDDTIMTLAKRYRITPFLVERIKADARLEGENFASWKEAEVRLAALAEDSNAPKSHRALTFHNRGVAFSRIGQPDNARECWIQALKIRPDLEIAAECLASESDSEVYDVSELGETNESGV